MTSFPSDRHVQRRVTVLCFLLYLPLGLARYNYSACLLALLAAEPFSRAAAGFIGTVSFFAFALGTALSGFVADRASSRRLVFAALLVSALSNLVFYCTRSYAVMLVAWAVNGLSHGPVFSCVMRLLSACYPRERVTGASIAIQCAFFVGMGLAYALSALLIRFCFWREAFLAAAVACAAFAILWNFGLRCADPYTDARQAESPYGSAPDPAAPSAWKLVCGAGLVVVPLSLAVQGILRDGVTAWGPSYVGDLFHLDASLAVASNMVIPFISILGIFAADVVRRLFRGNELTTAGVFFVCSAGMLTALLLTSGKSLALSLLLLAVSTACMSATNAMLLNAVPLQFGAYGRTGAISAVFNTAVYTGSGLSTCGIGMIVTALGWGATNGLWLLLAVLAAAACLLSARRWQRCKAARGWD